MELTKKLNFKQVVIIEQALELWIKYCDENRVKCEELDMVRVANDWQQRIDNAKSTLEIVENS